ncbi:hypothetical protein [Nocardia testacea]|uniref:hypothetical protein n=1 Tax=Nocardia testacea TaxID=248551 RepID=UPI0002E51023|nr:hypothetical protein [Nocardia testacea]
MKTVIKLVAGTLLGVGVLIGGIVTLTQDEVLCGATVMNAGDHCEETSGSGSSTTRDLDEQKSDNKTGGWIMIGLGSVILLVFGLGLLGVVTSNPPPGADRVPS